MKANAKSIVSILIAATSVSTFLFFAGTAEAADPGPAPAAGPDAGPDASPNPGPNAGAPTAAEGKVIWDEKKRAKCATCHGPDGKGDTKMGKSKKVSDMTTEAWQTKFTDQQIIDATLKGVEREEGGRKVKMEALKDGTQREAEALLAFIRSLGPKK